MGTTSPTLPADVVRIALEAAYLIPDHTLWDEYGRGRKVAWFASTLQVSRTWYIAGQQALYHRIQMVTQKERPTALLIRTLRQKPHIAQMVKVLGINSLAYRQQRRCTKGAIVLPKPSIPFITTKGRKDWRKQRQNKTLAQLLSLCVGLTELGLDQPDLTLLARLLDSMKASLERLSIGRAHEVSHDQWELLAKSTVWRNLHSIQLLATYPDWGKTFHEGIYGLDLAFLSGNPFVRLEKLELVGYVHAETLQTIIDVVRPTLTTLQCDQTNDISATWLGPASARLRNLVLSVSPFEPLANLSLFTRLDHLTVALRPETSRRRNSVSLISVHSLPSSISVFELHIPGQFNPWRAASDVAQVLHAFDIGLLPNLGQIVVSVDVGVLCELSTWTPAAFLLAGATKRRGLELRLDIRFKLHNHDLYKMDCFSRARHELDKAREVERAKKAELRGPPGVSDRVLDGLLTTAAHAYQYLCCVMYVSCCCCFLAQESE